jgi:hypothetical protein
MLINNVESMEDPKQVIPSLAGVDLAKHIYDFIPEGLYWSEGIGFRRLGIVINGEKDVLPLVGGVGSADQEKLIGQVVQSSSQAVNHLCDERGDLRRSRCNIVEVKECLSSIRVELRRDSISASISPRPHFPLQINALFLGPFNAL